MGCSLGKGGRLSGNRGLSAPPTHLYDYDDPIPSNATLRLCPRLASRARGRGHPARGFDPQVISLPGSAAVARMIGGPAEVVPLDIVIPDLQCRGPAVRRLAALLDVHFRAAS